MVDSVHWPKPSPIPTSIREKGLRLEKALRNCKELGGTSVLLVPGVCGAGEFLDECYRRSQDENPQGYSFGPRTRRQDRRRECLERFSSLAPRGRPIHRRVCRPDAIGWHMDIGNVVAYGYPEQWIRILGKRIVKLHAKDFSKKKMDEEGRWKGFDVKLGDGDVNWPDVMKALDEIGYNTWLCAEVAGGAADALKDIAVRMDRIIAL